MKSLKPSTVVASSLKWSFDPSSDPILDFTFVLLKIHLERMKEPTNLWSWNLQLLQQTSLYENHGQGLHPCHGQLLPVATHRSSDTSSNTGQNLWAEKTIGFKKKRFRRVRHHSCWRTSNLAARTNCPWWPWMKSDEDNLQLPSVSRLERKNHPLLHLMSWSKRRVRQRFVWHGNHRRETPGMVSCLDFMSGSNKSPITRRVTAFELWPLWTITILTNTFWPDSPAPWNTLWSWRRITKREVGLIHKSWWRRHFQEVCHRLRSCTCSQLHRTRFRSHGKCRLTPRSKSFPASVFITDRMKIWPGRRSEFPSRTRKMAESTWSKGWKRAQFTICTQLRCPVTVPVIRLNLWR